MDPIPPSEPSAAYLPAQQIPVPEPLSHAMPQLAKTKVQMTVDPEVPLYPCILLTVLGEFALPEVSLPPLTIPPVSVPSGIFEEVSWVSDPLTDLATVLLLASTTISMPVVSTPHLSLCLNWVPNHTPHSSALDSSRCNRAAPNPIRPAASSYVDN